MIASTSHEHSEAAWSKHRRLRAVFGFQAHVGADAATALVEHVAVTPGNVNDTGQRLGGGGGRIRFALDIGVQFGPKKHDDHGDPHPSHHADRRAQ